MNRIKRVLKKTAKKLVKNFTLDFIFPLAYRYFSRKPVTRGRVLFFETKEEEMPDSFDLLFALLKEARGYSPRYFTLMQNHVGYRQYLKNSIQALHDISRVEVVFLSDASDLISCIKLRPETRVVQLWHACGAFKKWGMSTAELKFGGNEKELLRHPFYRNLSLVTISSPEVSWAYEEAMVLQDTPEIIKPLGVSRTDKFFDPSFICAAKRRVRELIPQARDHKVILYAPTFRGRVASAKGPDALDISMLKDALSEEYVLLIKHHPFVKNPPEIPSDCRDFAFQVAGELAIDELLVVSDVCISDYSSLVFEYSLFSKPMAFFAYDIEDYSDWRGFYYDYDELTPGPVFMNNFELVDYLAHIDERFDVRPVIEFRRKFMNACDGRSTERIFEEVFVGPYEEVVKPGTTQVGVGDDAGGRIDVSVVVPAHNAMPELSRALDSVISQTYPLQNMEIVVVDDGSCDGTWDVLREYKQKYPGLFVLRRIETPSGSPAKPRNEGLSLARGKYVFFLDADDWLGSQAIARMVDHAEEWGSDVLLVKMKGEHGRNVPKSMFKENQASASIDNSNICWSFSPLKLYRRELVQGLRFPLDMPEDIAFVLEAYLKASRISVAADYDYYHVSFNPESDHASVTSWNDVHSSIRVYSQVLDLMSRYEKSEEEFRVVWRRLLVRDVVNTIRVATDRLIEIGEDEKAVMKTIGEMCERTGGTSALKVEDKQLLECYFAR